MSRVIALIIGAWTMYCSMIGSYDGAVTILGLYILAIVIFRHNKKGHDRRKQSCP